MSRYYIVTTRKTPLGLDDDWLVRAPSPDHARRRAEADGLVVLRVRPADGYRPRINRLRKAGKELL